MKLSHIRDVTAVAERGSVRAAARYLGIAQPAVSRSIRELEHELGVALFERSARGVRLTPLGELFVRRAQAAQSELRQAREEIDQHRGIGTGIVAAGLSTASLLSLLPRAIEPFQARFPKVLIKITEGLFTALEAGLKSGEIDFYIGPMAETRPSREFLVETLFANTRRIFCRKGHALAGETSLAALADALWIATRVTSCDSAELIEPFERHGLRSPQIGMQAPSALTMAIAAASSDMLVMLPEQWLDAPITKEMLTCIPVQEALPGPSICLIRRASLPLTPAAEYLSDLLRRSAADLTARRETTGWNPQAL